LHAGKGAATCAGLLFRHTQDIAHLISNKRHGEGVQIGEFSRLSMVPVSALRYYADLGLLEPAAVDPSSGYRYYTAAQLRLVNRIVALKELGLTLEEIRAVLREGLGRGSCAACCG